ncbi:MAG: hypothetical protein GX215_02030 [Clostridiales Family XIII bacterium]|nr:hypothetical protein [Clostridiales Family XIII bacterium]
MALLYAFFMPMQEVLTKNSNNSAFGLLLTPNIAISSLGRYPYTEERLKLALINIHILGLSGKKIPELQ